MQYTKYTALELLNMASVPDAEAKFGAVGINIGGITVNKPDHLINTLALTEIAIRVGADQYVAQIAPRTEPSEAVTAAIEAKGRAATEAIEARKTPETEE